MSTIYLQVQSTAANQTILPNSPILFNSSPVKSSDIDYISSTGMVILSQPGTYLVEWSVAASSPTPYEIGLATSTPQGTIIGATATAPDSLSGSAVVTTQGSAATLQLVNKTDTPLVLSNLPVVANLVVYASTSDSNGGADARTLTIPFSSASGATCLPALDATGRVTNVSVIGCGESSNIPVSYLVSGEIIQIPFAVDNAQYLFSFPYKVKLVAISGIFNNNTPILLNLPTTIISPFVGIATQALADTYTFNILEESKVYPSPGYQMLASPPQYIPSSKILTAYKTDLDIEIEAGEPFAIIGGLINLGLSVQALNPYIYMHGSMVFEIVE